jgi:hypothetical protein
MLKGCAFGLLVGARWNKGGLKIGFCCTLCDEGGVKSF